MTQMWTNFVKEGNPTPQVTATITALWPRVTSDLDYMLLKMT